MDQTSAGFDALSTVLRFMCATHAIPFNWDRHARALRPLRGFAAKLPTYIFFGLILLRASFMITSFVAHVQFSVQLGLEPLPLLNAFIHGLFIWSYALAIGYEINMLCLRTHCMNMVNHFFQLHERMQEFAIHGDGGGGREQGAVFPKAKASIGASLNLLILRVYPFFAMPVCAMAVGYFFMNYRAPWYYYSLVHAVTLSPPPFLIFPFALLECVEYFFVCNCICSVVLVMVCYWFSMTAWLREIRLDDPQMAGRGRVPVHATHDIIRSPSVSLRLYAMFQSLNEEFNGFYQGYDLAIFQVHMILGPVVGYHGLIRYHHVMPLEILFIFVQVVQVFTFFDLAVYPIAGKLNSLSALYIHSLVSAPAVVHSRLARRQRRACRALKVKIGSYFHISKHTSFKLLGLTVYWTVKSLLF